MGLNSKANVPVYRGPVSGLSFHDYGKYINKLVVGTALILRPVENQYDAKAVGVFYCDKLIGWIPKAKNEEVSRLVRRGVELTATITNHDLQAGFETRLYIQVYVDRSVADDDDDGLLPASTTSNTATQTATKTNITRKDTIMNKIEQVVDTNKKAITSAAFLEAGYIANKQMSKVLSKKLPMMVRGYADTPAGRLVVANLAVMLVQHFRPDNKQLVRLTSAMQTQAYGELIRELDIDGMIDELLESGSIKRAMNTLEAPGDE